MYYFCSLDFNTVAGYSRMLLLQLHEQGTSLQNVGKNSRYHFFSFYIFVGMNGFICKFTLSARYFILYSWINSLGP